MTGRPRVAKSAVRRSGRPAFLAWFDRYGRKVEMNCLSESLHLWR